MGEHAGRDATATADEPRLPRAVEADPRAPALRRRLAACRRPLWSGSAIAVPRVALGPALRTALIGARSAGRLVRGLESAATALGAEQRGLDRVARHVRAPGGPRVSRLLILADDGAERFYRQVEALLRRHGERVLALRVEADAAALGALLFGPGRLARLVLLEHKDAVAAALLALAIPPEPTS